MCSHHANPRTHGGAHLSGLRPHGHAEVHRRASCCSTSASKMASTNGRMRAQGPMTDLALTLGSSGERRGGIFMTVSVRLNHDDAMLFRKYAEMNGISMSELVHLCSCCVAGRFLHERYKSFSFRAHCVIMSCQFSERTPAYRGGSFLLQREQHR